MAIIYDLNAYRAPRLLCTFAQQTEVVSSMLHQHQKNLARLETGVDELQAGLRKTCAILHDAEVQLDKAHDAHDLSDKAIRSGAIEDLVAARDRLLKRAD